MAEDLLSEIASKQFFDQLKAINEGLDGALSKVLKFNEAGRSAEFAVKGAKDLKDVVTASNSLVDANGKLVASTQELSRAFTVYASAKERYNGSTDGLVKGAQEYAKVLKLEAQAQTEAARAAEVRARTSDRAEKAIQRESVANRRLTDDFYLLGKAWEDAKRKYQNYALQLGEGHEQTIQALDDANKLGAVYKRLNQNAGNFRDNVGNYPGGLSGAAAGASDAEKATSRFAKSLSFISGEFTNLAYGARTFFSSLSNNIGPAVEDARNLILALREARAQAVAGAEAQRVQATQMALASGQTQEAANRAGELAKQQTLATYSAQKGTSVIGALGRSLFSFSTIIGLTVAAFTVFGPKILDFIFGANEATKAADGLKKKFQEIYDQVRRSAAEEINTLRVLTNIAKDRNERMGDRINAAKKLQELYPSILGTLSQEKILEGETANAIRETTNAILAKARAQAASKRLEELGDRELTLLQKQTDLTKEYGEAVTSAADAAQNASDSDNELFASIGYAENVKRVAKEYRGVRTELMGIQKQQEGYLKFVDNNSVNSRGLFAGGLTDKPDKPQKTPKPTDYTNEQLKAEQDYTRELYAEYTRRAQIEADNALSIAENDQNSLDKRLAAHELYSQRLIEAAGYRTSAEYEVTERALEKIAEIEAKAAGKRTKEESALLLQKETLLARQNNIVAEFELAQTKIVNDEEKYRLDLREKYGKLAEKALEDRAKRLLAIAELEGRNSRRDTDKAEEERVKKLKGAALAIDTTLQAGNEIYGIFRAQADARISQYEQEIDLINKRRDAEINALALTGLTEEEQKRRSAEITAQAAAQELQVQQRIKEEKRKQAIADKAANVANVIGKTAIAILSALALTPPNVGLAVANGIVGAAQLANVLATPIPQYAKGTDGKYVTGLAVTDEAGPEGYLTKSGKFYLGQSGGPMIRNLTEPTQIIQSHEVMAMARQYTGLPALERMPQAQQNSADLERALAKHGEKLVKAINNKPESKIIYSAMGMRHFATIGTQQVERLHNLKN